MNNFDDEKKKRRKKDQFSVTIIGIIIYSVLLIFIMAGTYMGVKTVLSHYDEKKALMEEQLQEEDTAETEIDIPEDETQPEPEEVISEEDELNEHIVEWSSICDSQTKYIDYSQKLFMPGKRDSSLNWQDTVFSKIENTEHPSEAVINTYLYRCVSGYLLDGTEIVYDVYTNPETELIEKIISTTYTGDCSDVVAYYYNMGNVNYVFQYSKIVNSPVNISSAKIQSRYYFAKDTLVKYIYCVDDVATEYTVADLSTYSEGTIGQYDYLEQEVINSAYITYNIAKGLPDVEKVSGYVLDEFNQPMEGAKVRVIRNSDNALVAELEVDGDGRYSFELETTADSAFTLEASKGTLISTSVYMITALPGAGEFYVEPIYLSYEGNVNPYNVQILVRDATDMSKALPMASIKFRNGINNTNGEVIYESCLNEAGAVIIPIRSGCYTAQVSLGGYEDAYFTVVVKQDHQAVLGYAVPDLQDNTFATVLSWDTTPLDLDARIISSNEDHAFRGASDSIGSTTPEVVYVENAGTDVYNYFVSDYTAATGNDPLSYNMSSSNACVTIYNSDGMVASYHVPLAHSGYAWNAFKIRNRSVLPVNRYYYTLEQDTYWTSK